MRRSTVIRSASAAGLAAAVAASLVGVTAPGAHAAPAASRHTLANTTPKWLSHARHLGATSAGKGQSVTVYLAPKGGQAAMDAAVSAVSTPGSASYRKYLSSSQYFAKYAPTAATRQSVAAFLAANGLTVTDGDAHNRFLVASGTTKAAEKAFGVSLQDYSHDGQTVSAPSGATSLPADIAGSVLAVGGLDTTVATKKISSSAPAAQPPAAFRNAKPCSTYYGQLQATTKADYTTPLPKFEGKTLPYAVCGYTGPQYRGAYEANSTLGGAGVTVGIIDAYDSPTIFSDANYYAETNGDGSYAPGQYVYTDDTPFTHLAPIAKGGCSPSGWYGEQTLDVEAVHAMAPAAGIHFYGAKSCLDDDFRSIQRKLVDDNSVDIVSNSYGEPDSAESTSAIAADVQIFQQAAMEGISFAFSSGDNGDELQNTGIRQADSTASNPYVTAVGGTSTAIGASGQKLFDTGWGTESYSLSADGTSWVGGAYLYGAGGGFSNLFNRPSYQEGVVPSTAPAGRAVPDVAMDADPNTGMLIGETQTNPGGKKAYGTYRIGGTSLASPLFAGLTALKIQTSRGRLGFLNPAVYQQAGTSSFEDVKGTPPDAGNVRVNYKNGFDPSGGLSYFVRTFDQDSSLTTVKGWDDVTGVGVPTTAWFTPTGK